MSNHIETIKTHFHDHKETYIVGVSCFSFAVITVLYMRSSTAQRGVCEAIDAQRGSSNAASFVFRNKQTINVTTVLDREGRGHPGWPVRNLETKKIFFSQREAAKAFDIKEGILSGHLNGKFEDANGFHFERVSLGE